MFSTIFTPSTTAVAGSLPATALLGLIPLIVFFVMLGVFKVATHWCALSSLVASILVAVFGYAMPTTLALLSSTQGAAFGIFVICFIVVAAVWLYNLTETSGRAEDVRAVFSMVGKGDLRIQALLIAVCFCGLMEGLAGFGAPVAIACSMLFALGIPPLKAALVTMVGNALNVAFGAMAIPMITTARLGGVETELLTGTGTRITPLFFIWIPLVMLAMLDGKRAVKDLWPLGLVAGAGMSIGHIVTAQYLSYELTAVVASLLSFVLVALMMRVWKPRTPEDQRSRVDVASDLTASRIFFALFPYGFVVLVFAAAKLWRIGINVPAMLKTTDIAFPWRGLDGQLATVGGNISTDTVLRLSTLSSPGTMLILSGLIVTLVYSLNDSAGKYPFTFRQGIATLGTTLWSLRMAIITITAVMALAYTMNFSGQTVAIGTLLATTGVAFAFFSPILGWLGTAVTGSATSAGALFANLQVAAAQQTGLSPQLLLAVNEIGGGIGKIVSPQNLAIAATSVKNEGCEPELLRRAAPFSVGLVFLLGCITVLASTGVASFLIAQ
ncbi:L-lactate permease [Schaalia sp. lx-100]|uniref:L-lactate permease n=1 Tax=Schaalia sp. lx-100 TaxID=2899081 RepID=UPI001E4F6C4C|nr:L-lactate permease [Schaalia sp. lx-100]MCD4557813.1 L-lactate permease [Schaalia sp. lx-100]